MAPTSRDARSIQTSHIARTRYLTNNQAMGVKKQIEGGREGPWPGRTDTLGPGGPSLRGPLLPGAPSQNTANSLCPAPPPARHEERFRTSTGGRRQA